MTLCQRSRCRALAPASCCSMDRALAITRAVANSARFGIVVVLLGAATEAQSQVQTRLAIDGSVGVSRSAGGGPYSQRDGLAANAVAALRWTASTGHSAVVGLSAARVGPVGDEAVVCPTPDTCPTRSPAFRAEAVLVGWEWLRRNGASLRLLAGPGRFRVKSDHNVRLSGVDVRLDLGSPAAGPVSAVVSLQSARLSAYRGRPFQLWIASLGLRLR